MVKPIGFDPCDSSILGEDLFQSLLPIDVIKSISVYSEEKNKLKREITSKIDAKNKHLEDYLTLMRLDQLNLDQSAQQVRLPDELLQCSAAFTTQPDALSDLHDNFYSTYFSYYISFP
jgi:tyrosine-protein phosphatase non-receptor type 23